MHSWYIAKTLYGDDDEEVTPQNSGTVEEPKCKLITAFNILSKNGPYGFYVQLGEDRKGYLPKRASVSQQLTSRDNLRIRYKGLGHACLV
ncbi:hypothetical protein CsSME_00051685 [Camellia sinensis var. sinensis]